jgi:sugar phosphate permease
MRKIFYGWWLLLGLFLIYSATNGIGLNTLPLFYNQLIQEFNWSESEVTRPASLLYLLVAIASPFVGILLDRFKTKAIMAIGSFAIVGSLVLFSLINTLTQFTGVYLMYSLALTAAGIIPSMYLITKWFSKYRGIAVGIFLMGSSFGGAIFPQIAQYGFNQFEWRTAYLLLALGAAITILLPVIFLIRNRPEDMNTYPDGQRPVQQNQVHGDPPPILKSVTLSEALKSPLFYLLTIVTASIWFCIVGVINHQTIFLAVI